MELTAIRKQARTAGLLYLTVAVTAPIGVTYVPGKLLVPGDFTATADRIRASASLMRLGIFTEWFHQAVEVFLVLTLYALFKPVEPRLSRQMAALGLISIPIVFMNSLNEIAALILTTGHGALASFAAAQKDALAMFFLSLHTVGLWQIAGVFWGLWLFPFGLLVLRCGFIPKILGVGLLIAGSGYLLGALAPLILPRWSGLASSFATVLELGEPIMILWLVIWGARPAAQPLEGVT